MTTNEGIAPDESEQTTETVREESNLPTTEERLEHCYNEIGALRAEIAELRSHSHADLAHATHEHGEYASSDHKHEREPVEGSEHTSEPVTVDESGHTEGTDESPATVHPYFRKVGR